MALYFLLLPQELPSARWFQVLRIDILLRSVAHEHSAEPTSTLNWPLSVSLDRIQPEHSWPPRRGIARTVMFTFTTQSEIKLRFQPHGSGMRRFQNLGNV
jgi:hypothetical protein